MSVCGKCRRRKRSVSKGAPVPHNPLPGVSKGASCRRLTAVGEGHGDKEFVRRIDSTPSALHERNILNYCP